MRDLHSFKGEGRPVWLIVKDLKGERKIYKAMKRATGEIV